MAAYVRASAAQVVLLDPQTVVGALNDAYARDRFVSQFTQQTRAWLSAIPEFQAALRDALAAFPGAASWIVLCEFPLYRLRRRIDFVLLAGEVVVVIEAKVGAQEFNAADRRQVEDYAMDLRDFHSACRGRCILPVLWSTNAPPVTPVSVNTTPGVGRVISVGAARLPDFFKSLASLENAMSNQIDGPAWDEASYRPVPSVIDAATQIFAGHGVQSIANADAANLGSAAGRIISLIGDARAHHRRRLIFLTGVPGSGKTLAGLNVVHDAVATGVEAEGDIVYLSGNTPLVAVLREALAQDQYARRSEQSGNGLTLETIRRTVRARIQHINDFIKDNVSSDRAPHEHVIVFDEAQRAWDEKQGRTKFERDASEPELLLDIMSRHQDWSVCVCLVGGGQEINSGEDGVAGWGNALRHRVEHGDLPWQVFGPPDIVYGGASTGGLSLGTLGGLEVEQESQLQLHVPQRSFRSPQVSQWVDAVVAGDADLAKRLCPSLGDYPITLARTLEEAKTWLRLRARGNRRYGLLASSGARRLRADGLGVMLDASAGMDIAHWYLKPPGDIRSSFALEVAANQFTSQGLELDFAAVCWGGDFLRAPDTDGWAFSKLSGPRWKSVRSKSTQKFIANAYRVLMTRAREGLVIWIPEGSHEDATRHPGHLDATAEFLEQCGAQKVTAVELPI